MASVQKLITHQKSLNIKLDANTLGSVAEIGAGQNVPQSFLVVGDASGAVAKSISASDKEAGNGIHSCGQLVLRMQTPAALAADA